MADTNNPLRQVHTAFWTMLESGALFAADTAAGNRIKLNTDDEDPHKGEVSTADLPEVRVACTKVTGPFEATSNSSFMDTIWEVQIAAGERTQFIVFDVIWAVYSALRQWQTTLTGLTYNDRQFVHLTRVMDADLSEDDLEKNRGIQGWSCAWRALVRMHFKTTDLGT
jgi:hypothetical protein